MSAHRAGYFKKAALYSTDNGNKHIQGTGFKMALLGKEIMDFVPSKTINLGSPCAYVNRLLDKSKSCCVAC